jgi:hypothetical protein
MIATIVGLGVGGGAIQPEVGKKITDAADSILPVVQVVIDGLIQLAGMVGAIVLQYQQGKERSALKAIEAKKPAG